MNRDSPMTHGILVGGNSVSRKSTNRWGYLMMPTNRWGYLMMPTNRWGYLMMPTNHWGYLMMPTNHSIAYWN
jgi:hypothetical protein